jgi:predicted MFS family arabinose efflux permease
VPKDARASAPVLIALAGFTALAVAMGIGRFAFTPILPMMQQELAMSVRAGGWLASANYLGYILGALSATTLRVRAATAVRAGLVIIGLSTLGMGLTGSFPAWLALRALAGVASAWVLIFSSAWALGTLGAAARPVLRGLVFAGVGMGIAVAGLFCVALMRWGAGPVVAWQGLAIVALAGTAAIWHVLRPERDRRATDTRRPAGPGYRWSLDSMSLVLCYGALGFGYIIPATFVPAMARELVRDPLVFGWAWPIFGLAAAVSTLVAAVGARSVANRRLWALGHLVMALGVSAPMVWPTIGGIVVAALLVGGTFMVSTMSGLQEAQRVAGPHATTLMAAMTAGFATGQIGGPLLVSSAVGPHSDFSGPLRIACLLLVVSAGVLFRRGADTPANVLTR